MPIFLRKVFDGGPLGWYRSRRSIWLVAALLGSVLIHAGGAQPAAAFDPLAGPCRPVAALNVFPDGPGWTQPRLDQLTRAIDYVNTQYRNLNGGSWISTAQNANGGIPIRAILTGTVLGRVDCGATTAATGIEVNGGLLGQDAAFGHVLAHEILHAHGFSHSGGRRPNGSSNGLENMMENPASIPTISTCIVGGTTIEARNASVPPLVFSPDDGAQASYRSTGGGLNALLFANPGFQQTAGPLSSSAGPTSHGGWGAWGYLGSTYGEVVNSGGGFQNTSNYARLPGFGSYIYQAVSLTRTGADGQAHSQYRLTMAFRATSTGNIGWEVYTIPRDYAITNACGFPGNLDFNGSGHFGGWNLIAGSGGPHGAPNVPADCAVGAWCGYQTTGPVINLPRTAPWRGTAFMVVIYNHLNGGELNVDNATLYRAN